MKKWISDNKKYLIIAVIISAVLTAAYLTGIKPTPNTAAQKSSAVSVVSESSHKKDKEEKNNKHSETEKSTAKSNINKESSSISSVPEKLYSSKPEEIKQPSETTQLSSVVSDYHEESHESAIYTESSKEITSIISEPEVSENTSSESFAESITESSTESKIESSTESVTISSDTYNSEEAVRKCYLTIDCHTAVADKRLNKRTKALLPENGIILSEKTVSYSDGETVFDILKRCCEENGISLEFTLTPISGGAYIEGIGNLYEFDCGSISGWMYSVNGQFPAVGCSDYKADENDRISFIYSCDLGADIGNEYRG